MSHLTKTGVRAAALLITGLLLAGCEVADNLVARAMQQQVADNLSNRFLNELPDGLHVYVCGAGSPMPDPERAGPCLAVIAGQQLFLVDVGSGGVRNLGPAGIMAGRVEGVFLTHFHSDHIDGLGEIAMQRWAGGHHAEPLPVYGPEGVNSVVAGFNQAYELDVSYRIAHHGRDTVVPSGAGLAARSFTRPEGLEAITLVDDGNLRVTAFSVDHSPVSPAVGYRFDYKGRSILISGDTTRSKTVEKQARGVDLLLHEALSPELVAILAAGAREAGVAHMEKISHDILDYHTSPVDAARVAAAAGARQLVYYHIVPALPLRYLKRMFVRGVADVYDGPVTISTDGDFFSLPANGAEISRDNLR